MANEDEGVESAQPNLEDGLVQDERGHPVALATEARDFSTTDLKERDKISLREDRLSSFMESTKSLDRTRTTSTENDMTVSPARRSVTEDVANMPDFRPPKRTRTAPMERPSRPPLNTRRSVMRAGPKRTKTEMNMNEGTHHFFEYRFDDASSDSDSSLS